jgi:hypothetical protein
VSNDDVAAMVEQITKQCTDEGRIIEAGWRSMEVLVLPPTAPQVQRVEMRKAFFAGAQHLFASIMGVLDDDAEPTPDDLRRMELIHVELKAFEEELRREIRRKR